MKTLSISVISIFPFDKPFKRGIGSMREVKDYEIIYIKVHAKKTFFSPFEKRIGNEE
jgi:hypothetical protein